MSAGLMLRCYLVLSPTQSLVIGPQSPHWRSANRPLASLGQLAHTPPVSNVDMRGMGCTPQPCHCPANNVEMSSTQRVPELHGPISSPLVVHSYEHGPPLAGFVTFALPLVLAISADDTATSPEQARRCRQHTNMSFVEAAGAPHVTHGGEGLGSSQARKARAHLS